MAHSSVPTPSPCYTDLQDKLGVRVKHYVEHDLLQPMLHFEKSIVKDIAFLAIT